MALAIKTFAYKISNHFIILLLKKYVTKKPMVQKILFFKKHFLHRIIVRLLKITLKLILSLITFSAIANVGNRLVSRKTANGKHTLL